MPQAILLREYGDPGRLRAEAIALTPPGEHELRLRQTAIGVNFHDIYVRSGAYKTLALPGIPGLEAVGIVEQIGSAVRDFSEGDVVAYIDSGYGAYASERNIAADLCVRLPEGLNQRVAGTMFLKLLTAAVLLHRCCAVRAGNTLLVHAAAGGVGRLLVQWAAHIGARVIGTAGSREKAALARCYGCEDVIIYGDEDVAQRVLGLTSGAGVDIVFDAVGRDTFDASLQSLGMLGHLVAYGQASGPVPPFDISRLAMKGLTLSRPAYAHHVRTPEQLRTIAKIAFEAIESGIVGAEQGIAYRLADAGLAHAALETRETGPFVLIP